ncbi:hypothetical protein, partial [Mycolicibacterium gadium]
GETTDIRRVSLTGAHWSGARRWLAVQAVVVGVPTVAVLIILGMSPSRDAVMVGGVRIGWTLGWCLLGVAVATGVAALWRRLALMVTGSVSVAAVILVVVCAVAGAHHSHPFGSTAPVLLVWAALFCYNLAVAIWLVPDHIEGPAWAPLR